MTETLKPKDSTEAIAVFRSQVIGPLLCRDYGNQGELAEAIRELAAHVATPPGYEVSRYFSISTLERWYYGFKKHGLAGLKPKSRAAGFALKVDESTRELLIQIRRERPRVSSALILRTLVGEGKLDKGVLSPTTVCRFYAAHGLDRCTSRADEKPRRRWEVAATNLLWHTDVCHGPALRVNGRSVPLRIHALLDDHSRYVVAIQACSTERETEMLALCVKAFRGEGTPDALYTDNGPTYVGDALATLCARLGVGLIHAKPHDPQARGKMERFWRTLQEQCLDHMGELNSLHHVQVRLLAWLDQHYHVTAHSSLMGKTPPSVFAAVRRTPVPDVMLREALIVRGTRRLRRDATLSIAGSEFETTQSFLAGRNVVIGRSLLECSELPWIEHEDQRHVLTHVAPRDNAKQPRPRVRRGVDAVPFDPPGVLLAQATGKLSKRGHS